MRRLTSLAVAGTVLLSLEMTGLAAHATPAPSAGTARQAPSTTLEIKVRDCVGCQIGATSASTSDFDDVWSQEAKVKNGVATFKVPADRMHSMSFTLVAPWEGPMGYATGIVTRYAKTKPGTIVNFKTARSKKQASGCWAGSTEPAVSLRLKVRKVRVEGNGGRTWGTLAWFKKTQPWQGPMERVYNGVIGRQDVLFCEPRS